jgi:hypothetical protein
MNASLGGSGLCLSSARHVILIYIHEDLNSAHKKNDGKSFFRLLSPAETTITMRWQ